MEKLQLLKYLYRQQRGEALDFSLGRLAEEVDLLPKVSTETVETLLRNGHIEALTIMIEESEAGNQYDN